MLIDSPSNTPQMIATIGTIYVTMEAKTAPPD